MKRCTEIHKDELMKVDLSDRFIAGLKAQDKPTDYFEPKLEASISASPPKELRLGL